ncbi:hypothetical protein PMAYCL1PPCAC_20575, partial [Pristionchus mayeri]
AGIVVENTLYFVAHGVKWMIETNATSPRELQQRESGRLIEYPESFKRREATILADPGTVIVFLLCYSSFKCALK